MRRVESKRTPLLSRLCLSLASHCLSLSLPPYPFQGVHCTHGYNRTGFMICCYMVEALDMDPTDALVMFSKARSPGMIKYGICRASCLQRRPAPANPCPLPRPKPTSESTTSKISARSIISTRRPFCPSRCLSGTCRAQVSLAGLLLFLAKRLHS